MTVKKNERIKLEYGEPGNFGTLIPKTAKPFKLNRLMSEVCFKYPNDDRTITLVIDNTEIDWSTF